MSTRFHARRTTPRRGAILLVVLSMLALFAVIGLSFVLYAESEANAARTRKNAINVPPESSRATAPGMDAEDLERDVNRFLSLLMYDAPVTDLRATQSALYSQSLARAKYGFNYSAPSRSLSPFNGPGPITDTEEDPILISGAGLPGVGPISHSNWLLNYSYLPGSGFFLDREWTWYRTAPGQAFAGGGTMGFTPSYKSIAVPSTYPDTKDLYLAALGSDGSVQQPSFHRNWVFNLGTAQGTGDWVSPAGRLKILRPRPVDHTWNSTIEFPYPPANADGTVTGDVQNLPGRPGVQKNDSIWMYPAGQVRTWNGKKYTALVAPLIIDLGGRVNLSVTGNRNDNTGTGHTSSMGLGTWEINPKWVLNPNATTSGTLSSDTTLTAAYQKLFSGGTFVTDTSTASVPGRYGFGATTPPADLLTGQNQLATWTSVGARPPLPTDVGQFPPMYTGLDVNGRGGISTSMRANPVGGDTTSVFPNFSPVRYLDSNGATITAELNNHPAQFNSEFFASNGTAGRNFSPEDMRWLIASRPGRSDEVSTADIARLLPQYLIAGGFLSDGTTPRYNLGNPPSCPTTVPPSGTPTGYNADVTFGVTTDPANLARMLVTTHSKSTHRPELVVPAGGGNIARLGPIDISRPLPDYRADPSKMLLPDNVAPFGSGGGNQTASDKAQSSRNKLAGDIFVRLAAAVPGLIDGTNVFYLNDPAQPDYGMLAVQTAVPPGSAPFEQLRQLAQLAANMVDQIDSDDISTVFTWLPRNPAGEYVLNTVTGLPTIGGGPSSLTTTQFGDHVVFGTELPRLVINEVYSELANHRDDFNPPTMNQKDTPPMVMGKTPATQDLEKRFWVELFNPMRADPALSEKGATRLHYPTNSFNGVGSAFSPYQLIIAEGPANQLWTSKSNVTGSPRHATVAGVTIKCVVDKYTYDATDTPEDPGLAGAVNSYVGTETATGTIMTANTQHYIVQPHSGSGDGVSRQNVNGFCVIGPTEEMAGQNSPTPQVGASLRITPSNQSAGQNGTPATDRCAMQYTVGTKDPTAAAATATNTVVLRRLANPYLPPNDPLEGSFSSGTPINPYLTVDYVDSLTANDHARFDATDARMTLPGGAADWPTAIKAMKSYGRNHPFSATQIAQQMTNADGTASGDMNGPKSTLFKHNDNATPKLTMGATPFRWMAHLDRAPLNPVELVSTSVAPPHLLTNLFAYSNQYNQHTAEKWFLPGMGAGYNAILDGTTHPAADFQGMPAPTPPTEGFLHQALDLLACRGIVSQQALGAPQHGKVNLNTMWHPSVLKAVLDPSDAGTPLQPNYFSTTDVDAFWQKMTVNPMAMNPIIRTPSYPAVSSADRPFRSLAGSNGALGETILRSHDGGPAPLFAYDMAAAGLSAEAQQHAYARTEALRKLWNTTTTTSDSFLVIMTVSFFEVRYEDPTTNRVYLGAEMYKEVPGDLRAKYCAVLDRSNLALELDPATGTPTGLQEQAQPWFTTTMTDLPGGTFNMATPPSIVVQGQVSGADLKVFASGSAVTVTRGTPGTGTPIHIGFGDAALNSGDGERYTILSADATGLPQGQVRITVQPFNATYRAHPAGSTITNVLLGNPGPQQRFEFKNARYQNVVPFITQLPK